MEERKKKKNNAFFLNSRSNFEHVYKTLISIDTGPAIPSHSINHHVQHTCAGMVWYQFTCVCIGILVMLSWYLGDYNQYY